nr:hypothetical protein [Candidatus Sigynarchaeum springense]
MDRTIFRDASGEYCMACKKDLWTGEAMKRWRAGGNPYNHATGGSRGRIER